jgi:hypothetical protein
MLWVLHGRKGLRSSVLDTSILDHHPMMRSPIPNHEKEEDDRQMGLVGIKRIKAYEP